MREAISLGQKIKDKLIRQEPDLKPGKVYDTIENFYGELMVILDEYAVPKPDKKFPYLTVDISNGHLFTLRIENYIPFPDEQTITLEVRDSIEQKDPIKIVRVFRPTKSVGSFWIGHKRNKPSGVKELESLTREMRKVSESTLSVGRFERLS